MQQARRAEAQQLFALGQVEDEANPTLAFAYAIAALERTDTAGDPAIRAATALERTTGVCRAARKQRRCLEPCVQPRTANGWRTRDPIRACGGGMGRGRSNVGPFVRRQRHRTLRRRRSQARDLRAKEFRHRWSGRPGSSRSVSARTDRNPRRGAACHARRPADHDRDLARPKAPAQTLSSAHSPGQVSEGSALLRGGARRMQVDASGDSYLISYPGDRQLFASTLKEGAAGERKVLSTGAPIVELLARQPRRTHRSPGRRGRDCTSRRSPNRVSRSNSPVRQRDRARRSTMWPSTPWATGWLRLSSGKDCGCGI